MRFILHNVEMAVVCTWVGGWVGRGTRMGCREELGCLLWTMDCGFTGKVPGGKRNLSESWLFKVIMFNYS